MSFISVKLLAIERIYNDVFNSISLPLEWHYSALMGSTRSAVLVYACTRNAELFFCLSCKLILASNIFSSFLISFPLMCYLSFPLFSHLFLPVLHAPCNLVRHALLLLAGNLRLEQIVNPVDPLEILADVHWTHIREKEEEEKMVPTSKSSTSRGNLPQAPHHWFLDHGCSCLTLLLCCFCALQEQCISAGAAVVERNYFQITLKLHLVKHFPFQVSVCLK